MKKLVFFLALGFFSMSCTAQYYPNNDRDYGYSNNNGWNDDEDYRFPDDYYYEYPSDYYRDDYYRSFYNDYQRSIEMVNWSRFFRDYRLSNWQINMIMDLNSQFNSYYVWNDYYRMNPNRWYYDRFYALERIMGSRLFRIFYQVYYNGYNPVRYYTNYWKNYYRPRYYSYYVVPRYRTVNVNVFRVDPYDYHRNVGNKYGWNQPRNPHNPGGFREGNDTSGSTRRIGGMSNGNTNTTERSGGFRNDGNVMNERSTQKSASERSGGFRNDGNVRNDRSIQQNSSSERSGGFRTGTPTERAPQNREMNTERMRQPQPQNNGGFRNSENNRENNRVFENRSEPSRSNESGMRSGERSTETRSTSTRGGQIL